MYIQLSPVGDTHNLTINHAQTQQQSQILQQISRKPTTQKLQAHTNTHYMTAPEEK